MPVRESVEDLAQFGILNDTNPALSKDASMTSSFLNQVKISASSIEETKDGLMLSGAHVSLELPAAPLRYLYSGWQSWSLTAWVEKGRPIRPMRPSILRGMQTDRPTRRNPPAWILVRGGGNAGWQVLLLGALGLESHVRLEDEQTLTGWYESGQGEWFAGIGKEDEIFDRYANLLNERFGAGRFKTPCGYGAPGTACIRRSPKNAC